MTTVEQIPLAGKSLPVLGHAWEFLRNPLEFVGSLRSGAPLVRVRMGSRDVVMVCDRDLVRSVLLNDRVFDKGGPLYERARESMGNGLVSCPHAQHRRRRRLVQPAFAGERLASYTAPMSQATVAAVEKWREGQVLDISAELMALSSNITVRTIFAGDMPEGVAEAVIADFDVLVPGMFRRMVTPRVLSRLPLPSERRYTRAGEHARELVTRIVADRRAEEVDRGDLMSALHAADEAGGDEASSDRELTDDVFTFFLAGTETVASAVAWTLYLLAGDPAVEQRLQTEVDEVVGSGPVTLEHVERLTYARDVLKESMRLYPPVWLLTREVMEDVNLGGHLLPAGTTVAFSPYLVHRDPVSFDAGDTFDPSRWSGPNPRRGAYLPFAEGARKCVGERYAMTVTTLVLAEIVSRWSLSVANRRPVSPTAKASLAPRSLRMRVNARRTSAPA